jgi:hypothetical protein
LRLNDDRIIKVTRTAFEQPTYQYFERMLEEKTGKKARGSSPFVRKRPLCAVVLLNGII